MIRFWHWLNQQQSDSLNFNLYNYILGVLDTNEIVVLHKYPKNETLTSIPRISGVNTGNYTGYINNGNTIYNGNFDKIKTIEFTEDLSNVTSFDYAFEAIINLQNIVFTANTTLNNCESAKYCFNYFSKSVDTTDNNFNLLLNKIKYADNMFAYANDYTQGLTVSSNTPVFNFTLNNVFNNIITASGMFYNAENTEEIILSNAEFKNVTNTSNMFAFSSYSVGTILYYYYSSKLKKLDLSNATFESVTNASSMFRGCYNLTELKLSSSNKLFQNVTNTSRMFECFHLYDKDMLKNITFENVTNASKMFAGIYGVDTLNLSTSIKLFQNVTNASQMFYYPYNNTMKKLDLSNVKFDKVTNASKMFARNGGSYELLNLSSATFENVTDATDMFRTNFVYTQNGVKYEALILSSSNKLFQNVTTASCMFAGNHYTLDLSNVKFDKVTNATGMFSNGGPETLNLSIATFESVTNATNMFSYATNLKNLIVPNSNSFPLTLDLSTSPLTYDSILKVAYWIKSGVSQTLYVNQSIFTNFTQTQQDTIRNIVETQKGWSLQYNNTNLIFNQ